MKSALIFLCLSCTSCLCTKCRDCESSHEAVVNDSFTAVPKKGTPQVGKIKHDDTNRDLSYKGRKTPNSLNIKHRGGPIAHGVNGEYLLRPDTR